MTRKLSDFSLGVLVQLSLTVQELGTVRDLVDALLRRRPHEVAAHAIKAFVLHRQGDAQAAEESLAAARAIDVEDPFLAYVSGRIAAQKGDRGEAVRQFIRSVEELPWFRPSYGFLDQLLFPGPDYMELLKLVHEVVRPPVYLEIGVNRGKSIALATGSEIAVGVDPDLSHCPAESVPHARLVAATSDDFFARSDLNRVLEGRPVDLGFVDGMHLFEFCLRDFINMEKLCRRDSMIAIHDVIPSAPITAARERVTRQWVGDVWKIIPCLKEMRPDLDISLIMAGPSGLAIVRNLDPSSTVFSGGLDAAVEKYTALSYPGPDYGKAAGIRTLASDPAAIRKLLGPR